MEGPGQRTRFLEFCRVMGLSPMETSGLHLSNFLVYRSERTKSPHMLESDFKAIKCFRKAAGKPVSKVHIADAVLMGSQIIVAIDVGTRNGLGSNT